MAENDENVESEGEENKAGLGGKKKIILLALIALLLIGVSVGGTVTALKMLSPAPVEETLNEGEMAAEEDAPSLRPAIYYPLKPAYIINIDGRGRKRYLRLDISLLTRDVDMISVIDIHRASIDNTVNLVSSGQIYEDIQTPEGKEFLRLQLLQELQVVFEKEAGKPGIEQVLFTNFVIQ
ncbi:MAG: flagellar FliL protein [Flavobacteriales bacterium]|jgi:flagellar FliL protein